MIQEIGNSIRYPGGKGQPGHWHWLLAKMPTHAYYVELFAGSAKLFREKPPAFGSILVDRDVEVLNWHRKRNWPATEVLGGDGIRWLAQAQDELDDDWLIYCDPPYLLETRTKKKLYRFEMTDDDHRRFLLNAIDCPARVMISGYANPLYNDLLSEWTTDAREVMTRGGLRLETLWTNFDPKVTRRDSSPRAGKNWRERQRIQRKVNRHIRHFESMPDYEQDAVLSGLLDSRRRTRRG